MAEERDPFSRSSDAIFSFPPLPALVLSDRHSSLGLSVRLWKLISFVALDEMNWKRTRQAKEK